MFQPKTKKHVPRPPSSGRPRSKVRLRNLSSGGSAKSRPVTLNKNTCLPPVGQSRVELSPVGAGPSRYHYTPVGPSRLEHTPLVPSRLPIDTSDCDLSPIMSSSEVPLDSEPVHSQNVVENSELERQLPIVKETELDTVIGSSGNDKTEVTKSETVTLHEGQASDSKDSASAKQHEVVKDIKDNVNDNKDVPQRSHKKKDLSLATLRESLAQKVPKRKEEVPRQASSNKKEVTFDAIHETLGHPGTPDRKREFALESLSQTEARAMSGMLRQAAMEPLGSSRISSFIRSASRSRAGFSLNNSNLNSGRISTPEGRMVVSKISELSSLLMVKLVTVAFIRYNVNKQS